MDTIIITTGQFAVLTYLTIINLVTFFIYGLDKAKAGRAGARRVSEKALLILALIGGSLGALLGMKVFRHKTKKISFQAIFAVILAVQILLIWFIFTQL
jgi:uncharacterized membrane protein YsdA (DUF1294 family)